MANSSSSWVDLFKKGKWKEASNAIQNELASFTESEEDSQDRHTRRLILENNLFVCNQLSIDWNSRNEDTASHDWAKGFHTISELYVLMRFQHTCSALPLELILSITFNSMWWTVMKVDRLHQHCCSRETLGRAIFSFNTAWKSLGIWTYEDQMTGFVETDFIQAVKTSLSILTKVTPMVCQLIIEITILGCLILFDEDEKQEGSLRELKMVMDHLIECLPQLKVHVSWSGDIFKFENLIRFGWRDVSEFLKINISSISEVLLFTKAALHLRKSSEDMKEEAREALKVLAQIDKSVLTFPFLFHYLYAFANFNMGNLDTCLYHLLQASSSDSNFFMQGRASILKGQTLLLQDKAGLALQSLFSVDYKHKDIQIPLSPYLIGGAYQKLGKIKQQIEVLNLLLQCLSAEPAIEPRLHSPLVGIEHRLLLSVHSQPEISYQEVLQCVAMAHLSVKQPKEAAEKLVELLHVISVQMDNDMGDDASIRTICGLLHNTASAFLEAQSYHDAQKICESALQFHSRRSGAVLGTDLYNMKEDVIGLLLVAEAKDMLEVSGVSEILNRCASLLQNTINKLAKSGDECAETVSLSKALLARIYLHKALLNSKRKFEDDATACFQRALQWKEDDPEVILQFALHLLETNQMEESLALWTMYQDCDKSFKLPDDITLRYLLGPKMSLDLKEEIICRLQSLAQ